MLNHLKLTNKNLSFICDANPFKLNRYTPGSNIKIISKKYGHSLDELVAVIKEDESFLERLIIEPMEVTFLKTKGGKKVIVKK